MRLPLRVKILFCFSLVISATAAVGGAGLASLTSVRTAMDSMIATEVASVVAAGQVKHDSVELNNATLGVLLESDSAGRNAELARLAASRTRIRQALERLTGYDRLPAEFKAVAREVGDVLSV